MKLEPFNSLGLKDMHQEQINSLMEFIAEALNAAAEVDDDGECLHAMEEKADDLVHILGGNGVKVTVY